jgi:hypothetical protein
MHPSIACIVPEFENRGHPTGIACSVLARRANAMADFEHAHTALISSSTGYPKNGQTADSIMPDRPMSLCGAGSSVKG